MQVILETLSRARKEIEILNDNVPSILVPIQLPIVASWFGDNRNIDNTIITRKFQNTYYNDEGKRVFLEVYEGNIRQTQPSKEYKNVCKHYNKIEFDTIENPYIQCEDCGEKFYD